MHAHATLISRFQMMIFYNLTSHSHVQNILMTVVKQRNKIPFLCEIKTYVLAEKCFGSLCLGLAVDKLKIMMCLQHFNYNYFAQIRASLVLIMWTDFLLTI